MASPCDNHILISTSNRKSFTLFFYIRTNEYQFLGFSGFGLSPTQPYTGPITEIICRIYLLEKCIECFNVPKVKVDTYYKHSGISVDNHNLKDIISYPLVIAKKS